ncbi:ABC transporter substrate-binding protein [Roseobacteraceae bacterium S113]
MRYLGLAALAGLLSVVLCSGEAEAQLREYRYDVSAPSESLRIISTTDNAVFAPVIAAFQTENPTTGVIYVEASSTEINREITAGAKFDISISSAMDLQTKLANDGWTRSYVSDVTAAAPEWAVWRDAVFGFTQEPATIVLSRAAFDGIDIPRSRDALIALMRADPERFRGRIGTYDIHQSGLGYLFATQDSRTSETFWRLTERMGQLDVRLYCCSSEMIEDVRTGDIAIAYNVLGGYAPAATDDIVIIEPEDYTSVMLRSAVILESSRAPEASERFIDHLMQQAWVEGGALAPALTDTSNLRRIPFGPGLLVFLDRLKAAQFLSDWDSAVRQ